jgi:hypothetical protein
METDSHRVSDRYKKESDERRKIREGKLLLVRRERLVVKRVALQDVFLAVPEGVMPVGPRVDLIRARRRHGRHVVGSWQP